MAHTRLLLEAMDTRKIGTMEHRPRIAPVHPWLLSPPLILTIFRRMLLMPIPIQRRLVHRITGLRLTLNPTTAAASMELRLVAALIATVLLHLISMITVITATLPILRPSHRTRPVATLVTLPAVTMTLTRPTMITTTVDMMMDTTL